MVKFWVLSTLGVAGAAVLGGAVSRGIDRGALPWWTAMLTALSGGAVWGWMCRQGQPLVLVSLLYDVVATLTYTAFFVATGDRLSAVQLVGVGLSVIGLVLVSQK